MLLIRLIKTAFSVMRANALRTTLAVLGIVIGITAIIVVFSAGEGIYSLVVAQVESFGTNIIQTEPRIPKKGATQAQSEQRSASSMVQGVQITTLTLDD